VRRWSVTATVAAAIVVILVAVTASGGNGRSVRVEEEPSPTTTVAPGNQIVSYHGVHVEVPAGWPVVDGMHTQFCGGPFTDTPTAYLGPNENGAPGCPAPYPGRVVRRDGVWLVESSTPDPRSHTEVTASGARVLVSPSEPLSSFRTVWFHGVSITVGVGSDPAVAQAIVESIGYAADVPDTPRSGICARSADPNSMPTPERLASRLTLEQGNVILDPPRPEDQPVATAAEVWRARTWNPNYEQYRLILTRYTSPTPASPNGQGGYTPDHVDLLAWVVYAAPITDIPGCGYFGVDLFDAKTGAELESSSYGPGP
jgi:hypothetical protein